MRAREPRAIPITRILRFHAAAAWRYPALVVGCLLAAPLTILVDTVAPPLIVARVLDRLTRGDYQPDRLWASFHLELIAYAVVVVVGFIVTWRVVDAFLWRLEAGVQRDLAQRCFGHLIGQSADFHANNFGGSLVSQTNKLMGSYVRIQDTTVFQLIPLTCMVGSIVAIMSVQAPVFAAALAVFSVAFVITAMFVSKPVRRAGADHAATDSAQTGNLADAVSNVMAVKAFAREAHERTRFAGATDRTRESMLRLSRAHMRQMAWFGSLTSVISIGAFVVATDGVVSRGPGVGTAIGTMFLIVNYTISTVQQLWDFSSSGLRTYNRAFGDATDMLTILERESEIQDPAEPEPSRIRDGAVRFDGVVFRHAGSRDNLFDGLNLRIEPGERVGLVGHSGAGKTRTASTPRSGPTSRAGSPAVSSSPGPEGRSRPSGPGVGGLPAPGPGGPGAGSPTRPAAGSALSPARPAPASPGTRPSPPGCRRSGTPRP